MRLLRSAFGETHELIRDKNKTHPPSRIRMKKLCTVHYVGKDIYRGKFCIEPYRSHRRRTLRGRVKYTDESCSFPVLMTVTYEQSHGPTLEVLVCCGGSQEVWVNDSHRIKRFLHASSYANYPQTSMLRIIVSTANNNVCSQQLYSKSKLANRWNAFTHAVPKGAYRTSFNYSSIMFCSK